MASGRYSLTLGRDALAWFLVLALGGAGGSALWASEVYVISPHKRSRCNACHVSEDDETFLNENMNALCSKCHDQAEPRWRHHPLRPVPAGMTLPDSWPLAEGSLTCVTCHTPGHEEDRDVPMLLRGGPYGKLHSFCRTCHPAAGMGAKDPHKSINSGDLVCGTCHDKTPVPGRDTFETVGFVTKVSTLCFMCHDYVPHPAYRDHCQLQAEGYRVSIPTGLPSFEERPLCVSCHNPHIMENDAAKLRDVVIGIEICWRCHRSGDGGF